MVELEAKPNPEWLKKVSKQQAKEYGRLLARMLHRKFETFVSHQLKDNPNWNVKWTIDVKTVIR